MSKLLVVRNSHTGDPVTPGDFSGVVRMCIKEANSGRLAESGCHSLVVGKCFFKFPL